MATPADLVPYTSLNPDAKQTILFIHGAFGDGTAWNLVTPHLADCHCLVPDLPAHGRARYITPYTTESAVSHMRQLILAKAHGSIALIVGHSMGAHVAIRLASNHPEVVSQVLVSGYEVSPPTTLTPYLPYLIWNMQRIENIIPRTIIRWLMDGTDIQRVDTSVCMLSFCRDILTPMSEAEKWPAPWPARTLIIAAGKGSLIPSSDHPLDAQRLAQIGEEMNASTTAVTHPGMRHPWPRQAPLLFAAAVRAWFENEPLPNDFIALC